MKFSKSIYFFIIIYCSCSTSNYKQHNSDFQLPKRGIQEQKEVDFEYYISKEKWKQERPIEPKFYINTDYADSEAGAYQYFADNSTSIPIDLLDFRKTANSLANYQSRPIIALSYLAQIGYTDVENFLLDRFKTAFDDIIKNGHSLLEYQFLNEFNRLPPSKEKIDILINLIGVSQHCNYDFSSDFRVYKTILLNYYFIDVSDIHSNPNVKQKLYSEYIPFKDSTNCEYSKSRIVRDFPILRDRIKEQKINPIDSKTWASMDIWLTIGIIVE
jgi:hypothetical protein